MKGNHKKPLNRKSAFFSTAKEMEYIVTLHTCKQLCHTIKTQKQSQMELSQIYRIMNQNVKLIEVKADKTQASMVTDSLDEYC
jgi:hypothetical protein